MSLNLRSREQVNIKAQWQEQDVTVTLSPSFCPAHHSTALYRHSRVHITAGTLSR